MTLSRQGSISMSKLIFSALALFILFSCDTRPNKHEWALVASPGNLRIVYLSEPALADRAFISQVLKYLVKKGNIVVVQIFDSNVFIPHSQKMTEAEKLHWKARYEYNPVSGVERFEWVEVVDPTARPIALRFVEDSIRPAP